MTITLVTKLGQASKKMQMLKQFKTLKFKLTYNGQKTEYLSKICKLLN